MNNIIQTIREAVVLIVLIVLASVSARAQSGRKIADEILYEKVNKLADSIQRLNPVRAPRYLGYGVSLAFPQHQLKSNISRLDGLPVSFTGVCAGGVAANQRGKIKANIGLFYSNSSVPYTIDLWMASVTSNIYLLRLDNPKYHTLEPYAVLGVSQQMNRFFGNYLNANIKNYSTTKEPLLGVTNDTQLVFGGGLEYQLENDQQQFVHLFAEFTCAESLRTMSSNETYSATSALNSLMIAVGVNFGIVK